MPLNSTFWYKSSWCWPWFIVTGVQESNNFCANYVTKFKSIWMKCGVHDTFETCWCDQTHTFFFLSQPLSQYLRERSQLIKFCLKKKKNCNIDVCSHIYRPVSFKLGIMIETTMLDILVSVLRTWPSFKVTVVWKITNFVSIFSQMFLSI